MHPSRIERPSSPLDQISKLLPLLSRDELVQLSQKSKALSTITPQRAVVMKERSDVVQAVLLVSRQLGIETLHYMVQRECGKQKSAEKIALVEKFVQRASDNRSIQAALLRLGIEMVYEYLRVVGAPVTAGSVIRNLHLVPALMDRAFPGYARFGLLEHVVNIVGGAGVWDAKSN